MTEISSLGRILFITLGCAKNEVDTDRSAPFFLPLVLRRPST